MNCLSHIKKVLITSLLVDGMGTRAICRVANVASPTVGNFIRDLGAGCLEFLDENVRDLDAKNVQCDEMWTFVQSRAFPAWVWMALDPKSKLLITWRIGNRSLETGQRFMDDVHSRVTGPITVTTDAHNVYGEAMEKHGTTEHAVALAGGYKSRRLLGNASTYAVERHNLTVRTSISRFARSTNGFSKSTMHMNAHMAIYAMHYNYVRLNMAHRVTPAMEAGLTREPMDINDIVDLHPVSNKGGTVRLRVPAVSVEDTLALRLDVLKRAHTPRFKRLDAKNHRRDHRGDSVGNISAEWHPFHLLKEDKKTAQG